MVNNNIVLIDTFNQLKREQQAEIVSLVVQAGTIRLRPVMLTTLTTVFGLMPLAMNFSVDLIARMSRTAVRCPVFGCSQAIVWGSACIRTHADRDPAMLTLPDSMKRRLLSLRGLLPPRTADLT